MVSTFFSYLHGTCPPLLSRPSSPARVLFLHRGRCALTDQRRVCPEKTGNQCPPLALVPLRRRLPCCRQAWPTYPAQPFLNYRFLGVLPPSSIKFSRTQACPVHCSRRRNQRRPLINALLRHLPPSSSYLPPARVFPSAFPTLSPHCYKR